MKAIACSAFDSSYITETLYEFEIKFKFYQRWPEAAKEIVKNKGMGNYIIHAHLEFPVVIKLYQSHFFELCRIVNQFENEESEHIGRS